MPEGGIDHISRIFHQSQSVAAEDIDIVEQLALLKLPPNVHLIIGSQPGPHLSPLQSPDNLFLLPGWQPDDVESLVEKLGLLEALASNGHDDQAETVVQKIAHRSEGNPLYATFMVREVVSRTKIGEAVDILSLIDQIPSRMGDLGRYYDYLFQRIEEHHAVSVAETLALLDFGVSRSDLRDIYPAEAHRLSGAIPVLSPILEQASAQGGFRIYHESFRRFVVEKLVAQEASVNSRLEPVCNWLEQKGFLSDSRAYRFLLPTLRRANLDQEILKCLSPSFMQDSLSNGQPSAAIALNLVVGAEVAARIQNWEALARINELQRANSTYISGRPFAQLQEAGMHTVKLDEILRQRDPELKEAVEMLARGHIASAIESLNIQGRVHQLVGREARIGAIAREYAASPENTLVVSPDNRSRADINTAIHRELQGQSSLVDAKVISFITSWTNSLPSRASVAFSQSF